MRILRVIDTLDPARGGPAEGIRQICSTPTMRQHVTEVVCLDDPDAGWLKESRLPVHALGHGRSAYAYHAGLLSWLRANSSGYDAVIVHGLWQYMGLAVRIALRGSAVPYYIYPHGMLDPYFRRAYPLKHLKKAAYWLLAERSVLRDACRVCFTSEDERLLARQTFPAPRYRETIISQGANAPAGDKEAQRAAFLSDFPHLRGQNPLLFLGRFHPKKGCDLLIDALAKAARKHPSAHLIMAGPDSVGWQAQLQRRAEESGIGDRITWTGLLQGDRKWGAFYAADAFVLPSHHENFGIAVAEALACGVPVLISKQVNIWREIEASEAGLVGNDDAESVKRLVGDWLGLPEDRRERIRANARPCFDTHFEFDLAAARLVNLLSLDKSEREVGRVRA